MDEITKNLSGASAIINSILRQEGPRLHQSILKRLSEAETKINQSISKLQEPKA